MYKQLFIIFSLILATGVHAKPNECNEMEPVFSTGEWEKGSSDFYSCLGKIFYFDGTQFFYTVTSKNGSEEIERYNFALIFSSTDRYKKYADILRLLDKVSVLLKMQTGKVVPENFAKAALEMRDGDYFVEGKHVSISTSSSTTDISISVWK